MDNYLKISSESKSDEVDLIIERIKEWGFVLIPNLASQEQVDKLLNLFHNGLNINKCSYGYGQMSRFESFPEQLSSIANFFCDPIFHEVIKKFWGQRTIKQEYSLIHDFQFDPCTIYGNLHYDRRHQLKFMLYLTDVLSPQDGAFHVIPRSHIFGKSMYSKSWKKVLSIESNEYNEIEKNALQVPDNDSRYRSLPFRLIEDNIPITGFAASDAIPIIGKAGTLIIFDTHVIHSGGVVSKNHERKSIRLHSFPII